VSEWIEHRLGEVCSRLRSGSNITAKDIHESGSFPVFGGNGIRGYAAEANFSGECTIIGRQGAYCGNVRYFKGEARMSEHAIVACAGPSHHTRFLAYILSNMNLGSLSGQAAQPGLSVKVLAQQLVRMPSRQNQERIASILGAYDDLIEVNRRRVAVLEEMARGLFEEWFVRFRFPGHENVPIIDTPDGLLPEGWSFSTIGSVCSVIRSGSTPSRKSELFWKDGVLDWYTTGELNDGFLLGSKEQISKIALDEARARKFPDGTVFLALYGATIGKLGIAISECSSNQAALGLVADGTRMKRWQLYHTLYAMRDWFISIGQGAAQQNISKEKVSDAKFPLPPQSLVDKFDHVASSCWELRATIEKQQAQLTASRDLLLPRLISGKLSVASAERELEEVA
jgi:type I restriction enzyme S subunit